MATEDAPTPSCLVDEGLHALASGLGSFVLEVLKHVHGEQWWDKAVLPVLKAPDRERILRNTVSDDRARIESLDVRALLGVSISWWTNSFVERLAAPARSYLGEVLFYANWHAHQNRRHRLTMSDAARALDTMWRLLERCASNESHPGLASSLKKVVQLRSQAQQQSDGESQGTVDVAAGPGVQQHVAGDAPASSTRQLPLRDAYPFAERHGLGDRAERIMAARPPDRGHPSVYRRALLARSLAQEGLLDRFIDECWPHGKTEDGRRLLKGYERLLERLNDSGQLNGPVGVGREPEGWQEVKDLIGVVEGPEDLAAEHDHYLYGTPKRQDPPSR